MEIEAAESKEMELHAPTGLSKKKRKRPEKKTVLAEYTLRDPPWAYLHLRHHTKYGAMAAQGVSLDETTVSLFLDAALGQFLGIHGRAIPSDILKLDGSDVWIRIPNQDRPALTAALTGWIGRNGDMFRVVGWSSWNANALARDAGQDLFND